MINIPNIKQLVLKTVKPHSQNLTKQLIIRIGFGTVFGQLVSTLSYLPLTSQLIHSSIFIRYNRKGGGIQTTINRLFMYPLELFILTDLNQAHKTTSRELSNSNAI